jgi:hypothetical protein
MPQQKPKHENRHIVIRKGDAFGNLVLCIDCVRNATASFVPRADPPQIMRSYETPEQARLEFNAVILTAQNHGWTIIHDGRPNFG